MMKLCNPFKKKPEPENNLPFSGLVQLTDQVTDAFRQLGKAMIIGSPKQQSKVQGLVKTLKVHVRYGEDTKDYKRVVEHVKAIVMMLRPYTHIEFYPVTANILTDIETARHCDLVISKSGDAGIFNSALTYLEPPHIDSFDLGQVLDMLKMFETAIDKLQRTEE